MLIIIFAESSLETIPRSIWNHQSVKRNSKKRGKSPRFLLLDRSYHHSAMKTCGQSGKRGRPDILHFSLLEALGSPLNKEGLLQVYVHTFKDYVIRVKPKSRLPRNYNRFVGLIEQLFRLGRAPPKGPTLLELRQETLPQLIHEIEPSYTVAFCRSGFPKTLQSLFSKLSEKEKLVLIIGGFAHGHLSSSIIDIANEIVSLDPEALETGVVTSRVIYEYERSISLPRDRLARAIFNG